MILQYYVIVLGDSGTSVDNEHACITKTITSTTRSGHKGANCYIREQASMQGLLEIFEFSFRVLALIGDSVSN